MSTAQPQNPRAQIETQLTSTLTTADAAATQGVQNMKLVHQARLTQLTRTAASLTAKYGASDPRTLRAQSAVAGASATVARVAMVYQQTATSAPAVAAGGWALYGHVYLPNASAPSQPNPAVRYTVFLVDSQKTYQEAYGFAYTDSTGYFLISYAGPQSSGTQSTGTAAAETSSSGTESSAPAPPQGQSPPPGQSQTTPALYLEIADTKAQPVYLSASPFQPTIGSATYQNVTLPSGDQPIGDPPDSIRKVAMPGK
jgi:hypothetical protein